MTSRLRQWLEEENLYITPRTRCKGCGQTAAQIYRSHGQYGLLDSIFLEEGNDHIMVLDDAKAGWYCWPCIEYDQSEPKATAALCTGGEQYHFRIGQYGITECGDGEVPGALFEEVVRPYAKSLVWHSTDPWRGYYESHFSDRWTKVIDDWFGIDGYNVTGKLGRFHQKYKTEKTMPNCDLLVAFPRTSNVCTCGIEVYVRLEDMSIFQAWLEISATETEDAWKQ